jgi:hypothetical protein
MFSPKREPAIGPDELIQRMSKENPLWGAPRIHGELLKLGFEIAESTVSKYMIRRPGPQSFTNRIRTMGIRDRSISPRHPGRMHMLSA